MRSDTPNYWNIPSHGLLRLVTRRCAPAFFLLLIASLIGCGSNILSSPTAAINGPYQGAAGVPVTFSAQGSSAPNGASINYSWNFGDGATGAGLQTSHVYSSAGVYTATLQVSAGPITSAKASATATASTAVTIAATATTALRGKVHGGQQPVQNSTVQLWQVGTTGYGTGAIPLGNAVLTDSGGNFTLTGQYSCSTAANGGNTLIYITATGGNPGLSQGTNNTALALMATLGFCSSLTASTNIILDEVTTVGSVYGLAQFMGSDGQVGAIGTNPQGLVNAFATTNNLVSVSQGTALAVTPSGNGVVPTSKLNTLADVMASCINSASSTSTSCSALLGAVSPLNGTAPSTTIGATLSIALNPSYNVSNILMLILPQSPFQPTLPSDSVKDLSIAIGYAAGGIAPTAIAVDGNGNIWTANSGNGTAGTSSISFLSSTGTPASNSPFSASNALSNASALAIDTTNKVWVASKGNNSAIQVAASTSGGVSTIATTAGPYSSAALNAPQGVALDANANLWFTNAGNSSLTEIPASNYAGSGTTYNTLGLSTPQGIAFDSFGTAWITNLANGTVTAVNTTAPPATGLNYTSTGVAAPAGIAIDASSNIWVTDGTTAVAAEINNGGATLSPAPGLTGGGLSAAHSAAIDGNGNLWVPGSSSNNIAVFSPTGTAITSATGITDSTLSSPSALAIDGSGNVWIANQSPKVVSGVAVTVTELVGVASPVIVPLQSAVVTKQIARRPGTPLPPVAISGGPYGGIAGSPISFNAAASSDPNSLALTYSWTFGDGAVGSSANVPHGYTTAGTYPVTLTVTNSANISTSIGTVAIISTQPLVPPVASPGGPYSGVTGTAVSFDGTGSFDPTHSNAGAFGVTLAWNFGDGSTSAGTSPIHTFSGTGVFTVSVTATSPSGATATSSTTASISQGASSPDAPTGNANGPYTGVAGTPVQFNNAGSSDPNSNPLTYFWNFGDGTSANTSNPTHAYTSAGTYSVVLLTNNGLQSTSVGTTAKITAPTPQNLIANAGGPYTAQQNQVLQLNATGTTNPNSALLVYTWDFGDGSTGTGAQPYHVWATQGSFTVNLSVSDGVGLTGNATAHVTVGPPPAEAVTASAGGPYTGTNNQSIQFDASGSRDNVNYPLTYSWNFGDGTTGTGLNPTHSYAATGTYTVSITATSGTATASATASVVITPLLTIAITSPTPNTLTGLNTITVSGTVSLPGSTVTVNGVNGQMNGNNFTATGIGLREGVNIISATATGSNGAVGSASVAVIVTLTPPGISITSPAANASVAQSNITIAGLVTDVVTGTIGTNPITVKVNGQVAQVSNHSFELPNVLLAPGANTITAISTDAVGNTSQATITVNFIPATQALSLNILSGDAQTGTVKSVLPQALVVQLLSASGTPVPGRSVTFAVSRSDGQVEVMPNVSQSQSVTTDANGKASVLFQLGSRQGLAVNQVTASTPGAAGTVTFTASTNPGPPAQIIAVRGEYQRGIIGQALAEAFQVLVTDAYANPIPGATVGFTSIGASDGSLSTASATTDANGKAYSTLTLGQQEGINNYLVSASLSGTSSAPVQFSASAYAPGPVADTIVSGVVLDDSNSPVPNATVKLQGTSLSTVTNTNGVFSITNAPVGTVILTVDGSTSTSTQTFPFLTFVLQSLPGVNNTVGKPIYLPALDIADAQTVGGSSAVTLGIKGIPGASLVVAPNSVTFPDGSTVGQLTVSQIRSDMVPMQPKDGSQPGLLWTIQPAGTKFNPPIQVTVPNTDGLPQGAVSEFYQFDHDLEQFVSAGTGHVSTDGSVIISDAGFGITKAGWIHAPTYPLPTSCIASCDDHNICTDDRVDPNNCHACINKGVDGRRCGKASDPGSCRGNGLCIGAYCNSNWLNDGTPCDNGVFCQQPETCQGGTCIGKEKPKSSVTGVPGSVLKFEKAFESGIGPLFVIAKDDFHIPISIEPTFTPYGSITHSCCEARKVDDSEQDLAGLDVNVKFSTPKIPLPPPFDLFYVPFVGSVGLYVAADLKIGGKVEFQSDDCPNPATFCFSGGPYAALTIEGGILAQAGPAASANIGLSGGVSAGITIKCDDATFDVGAQALNLVLGYTTFGGKQGSLEIPLIPATSLGAASYSFH